MVTDVQRERVIIVGGGNMGAAFARGIITTSFVPAHAVTVIEPNTATQRALEAELQCCVASELSSFVETLPPEVHSRTILIAAVKPDLMGPVLQSIPVRRFSSLLVISCAAGVRLETMQTSLSGHPFVIRAMPNLPVQLLQGVVGYYAASEVPEELKQAAASIFTSLGVAFAVEREELLDALTAVSGSGPGYWAFLIAALVKQTEAFGFSESDSRSMVLQTLRGTLALLESGEGPSELEARVTSPGGTTACALSVLRELDVAESLQRAVRGACERAKELGE